MFKSIMTVFLFVGLLTNGHAAQAPDWKALEEEAVSLLSRYIQIDTANPELVYGTPDFLSISIRTNTLCQAGCSKRATGGFGSVPSPW